MKFGSSLTAVQFWHVFKLCVSQVFICKLGVKIVFSSEDCGEAQPVQVTWRASASTLLASVRCQLCERLPEPFSLDVRNPFISVVQSQMELFKNTFKIFNMFQNIHLNSVRAFLY